MFRLPGSRCFSHTYMVPVGSLDYSRLTAALEKATAELLAARNANGFWEGELSSSALSTATAVTALAVALKHSAVSESQISNFESQIEAGLKWLVTYTNPDGGWGDTTKSLSNISTTTLCWAAFGAAHGDEKFSAAVHNAERWLAARAGSIAPNQIAQTIIARYGKDRTFSVPILTMCALAGRLGDGRDAWKHVIALPFELAACPHQLFAALRLPVVSYALPALIAIGQAHHVHAPSRNPLARLIRNMTREKTMRVLTEIQPGNGGFLEATPLTSFVTMSLAGSGQANHIVTQRGLDFLRKSQRADGSWPIDTNLATWCTTLAVDALDASEIENQQSTIKWLLKQQYKVEHPYTHAAPGGWAWTDLPGGVPDADDTAGALLALARLSMIDGKSPSADVKRAAEAGIRWLLSLQNRDGGIPTFCRGWGALPFDRSSADITAHAIRAWLAWKKEMPLELQRRIEHALDRALMFLVRSSRSDGTFVPLWFGNQFAENEENRTYGTTRVMLAMADCERLGTRSPKFDLIKNLHLSILDHGTRWLLDAQQFDGAWSGNVCRNPSVEETALAVQALAAALGCERLFDGDMKRERLINALDRGVTWLIGRVESGAWREPSPIGFYFAKLWYFERLYPLIFAVGALRTVVEADAEAQRRQDAKA
jgi:squalene-hopene/tetraprenyl-beta-curcumene cyclase